MPGYKVKHSRRPLTPNKCIAILMIIASGIYGWFLGLFLYGDAVAEITDTYICTTQKGTWVNVREAPSKDAKVIGTLRYGYEIQPLGEKDGYFLISMNDRDAYVRKEFFEIPFKARGIATCRVQTRAKPNGKKLGLMNRGSWIDILAKTVDADGDDWYRCYGNVYIMSKYLEVAK